MLLQLKPLYYNNVSKDHIECKTPLHQYDIRYDYLEQKYRVNYKEYSTNNIGFTYVNSIAEAKEWIEKTHLPSKLKQSFVDVSKPTEKMVNQGIKAFNKSDGTQSIYKTIIDVYEGMVSNLN